MNAEDNSDVVADSVCDFIHRAEESGRSRASRARRNCVLQRVITGRTFSAAECGLLVCRFTDRSGRQVSGNQGHYGDGYGPCIPSREEGERNNEILCKFGPGFLESRGKPVQAFSSPNCAEAKVEFRQCLNGTLLGSYQYPNCQ